MKIYTKTGDKGSTSLLGGSRVKKFHQRIESYGAIDELNAHVGLLIDFSLNDTNKDTLTHIQNKLFTIGSNLADDSENNKFKLPKIEEKDVVFLENEIDTLEASLPKLTNFILPGGHTSISQTHICRCICRRAERNVVKLNESVAVNVDIIAYLNRLSDYFFTLSRSISQELGVEPTLWSSK